ncbi:pilus assembly protein PilO [Yersinia kristensenii]|uniref:pilus assembly protein PilO n=1 Tax=Yersinia kristensenii TaxID=28152 RepID=UPI000B672C5C|nr:pilus assembly protein PilO [Yersinia kristensenii]MBW5812229.1 pilus assembly protein PilO [Yersinia kristensenii]MBW5815481.1 pilus assembly protein PilO [Yersinia kristensenii]MBW5829283.1 pilus assembly protein PilO [Yersinia kristensenii]MBW5841390.1 pilus assembly protein PilO [Yersinia kristensenii]MDA5488152.1 pilus assembly protein PilO [Yersinia kristensenii]
MNKQLQRWMDRPGWQLCLYQWGVLGLLGVSVYGMVLRPLWQQQRLVTKEIIQHQQQVEHQQSALAQLPSLAALDQQITVLSAAEAPWRQPDISMAHLVGQWIIPFGGQVMSWQRQSEQSVAAGRNSAEQQQLANHQQLANQQQWHATLRVNFYGLLHLLRQLAATSVPVQIQIMGITREKHALTVKLSLKESLTGGESE